MIELKENPFFIQERGISLTNHRFRMLKFKTISSRKKELFFFEHEFLIPIHTNHLTTIANFLRRKGLDELPQLFQVLTGKLNIVGPRPLMIEDLVIMENNFPDEYRKRNLMNIKPGITGLWQLYGNKKNGINDLIEFDNSYLQKKSIITDLKIILHTIKYIFSSNRN